MSTFTVIDAAKIMHAVLVQCWDENKRYRARVQDANEEYTRRLAQIDNACAQRNQEAQKAYEEMLARMEKERQLAL